MVFITANFAKNNNLLPTSNTPNISLPTIGNTFIELAEIDSTNTYAMKQIQAKVAEHGTAYFAHNQTNGKGTRGKSWHSETGNNIILSVVLNINWLSVRNQFLLSAWAALAVFDFLSKYVQNGIKIKWTNDIYIDNSKIAGILIENKVKGNKLQWAVVGIGININQINFDSTLSKATSLALVTNKKYDALLLSKELCFCLEKRFQSLINKDANGLINDYNKNLFKLNEVVKLKKDNLLFNCTIKKVTKTGFLVVNNGIEQQLAFGEVEWILS